MKTIHTPETASRLCSKTFLSKLRQIAKVKNATTVFVAVLLGLLTPQVSEAATININSYPRIGGETEDGPRFSRAIAAMSNGDILELNAATYSFTSAVTLKSNITIKGVGQTSLCKVMATGFSLFEYAGLDHITFENFKVQGLQPIDINGAVGDTPFDGGSAGTGHYITFKDMRMQYNQGHFVGISGNHGVFTGTNVISDCNGYGIMLWANTCTAGNFDGITVDYAGSGVGGHWIQSNTFGTLLTTDCGLAGLNFDGIAAGQSCDYNTVSSITASGCGFDVGAASGGAAAYGGIYVGNTSHHNTFTTSNSSNNYHTGLNMREADQNGFYTATFSNNALNGARTQDPGAGATQNNWIGSVGLTTNSNTVDGIHSAGLITWWGNSTIGGQSRYNGNQGMEFNTEGDNNVSRKMFVTNNTSYGIWVATGATGNSFYTLTLSANNGGGSQALYQEAVSIFP